MRGKRRGRDYKGTGGNFEVMPMFIILIVVWFHGYTLMTKSIKIYTLSMLCLCQVYLNKAVHFLIKNNNRGKKKNLALVSPV